MIDLIKIEQEIGQKILEDNDPFKLDIKPDTITITGIVLDEDGEHYADIEVCSYDGDLSDTEKITGFFLFFMFEKQKYIEMLEEYIENFIYNLNEDRE